MAIQSTTTLVGAAHPSFSTNITDLEVVWLNGQPRLFSATQPGIGGGYAVYDLSAGGNAGLLAVQGYSTQVIHGAAPDITILSGTGGAHLIAAGPVPSGWASYSLTTSGTFGQRLDAALAFNPVAVAALPSGAGDLVFLAPAGSDQPVAAWLTAGGVLALVDPAATIPAGAGLDDLTVAASGADNFLLSVSATTSTITSYRIDPAGTLTLADRIDAAGGVGFSKPTEVSHLSVGGQDFAIVAANESSSLSVFRIQPDGILQEADHVVDGLTTRFQGATALATLQSSAGRAYVAVGGSDGGVDIMTLLPDGRLVSLATIADDSATSLDHVSALALAEVGGTTTLFAASATEPGLTQIRLNLGPPGIIEWGSGGTITGTAGGDMLGAGAATTVIDGGAGDDLIVAGGGVALYGGAGADIFVLAPDGRTITIKDYEAGIDRLDLTSFPMLRNLGQLQITSTATGAELCYLGTTIQIESATGTPIAAAAFAQSQLLPFSRYLPPGAVTEIIRSGTAANDRLQAGPENTRLLGLGGNDFMAGGSGRDILQGGAGNDTIRGYGGNDRVFGDAGNDLIAGGTGDDYLDGGDGNDQFWGEEGNDTLAGGAGNDRFYCGAGGDVALGGAGNDTLDGQDGNDELAGDEGDDEVIGGAGNDTLYGGNGSDFLWDASGDDFLYGEAGNDRLYGGPGNDLLDGGGDHDRIFGGTGNDLILAGTGNDFATGDDGNDTIYGGAGNDRLDGGKGDDQILGDEGADILLGGFGNDLMDGGAGNDLLDGGYGADSLYGGGGDDTLTGGYGANLLDGGDGRDRISGGAHADQIFGGDDADWCAGMGGNDTIRGGAGNDQIGGGAGNDQLRGDGGNDWIEGAAGDDLLYGDSGNDLLSGSDGNDTLYGGSGHDTLGGGTGFDLLDGGDGDDLLNGGDRGDRLIGGAGNDTLWGGAGNDLIDGGAGRDRIIPGSGKDLIYGGAGSDTFAFSRASDIGLWANADRIFDFVSGEDRIDLRGMGLRYGGISPTGGKGVLHAIVSGDDLILVANLDGRGGNDFSLYLHDAGSIALTDFLL